MDRRRSAVPVGAPEGRVGPDRQGDRQARRGHQALRDRPILLAPRVRRDHQVRRDHRVLRRLAFQNLLPGQ